MEKGFWAIPKSIAKRKDLSLKAKLVVGVLWTRKDSDFKAFPSRRYIAEALGVSIKSVDRGIKELKERTNLRVERKGLRRNNRYLLPDWNGSNAPNLSSFEKTVMPTQGSSTVSTPILRDYKKDNTVVGEKASSVKEIFSYFKKRVRDSKGFDPEINWVKDGRMIKLRLKKYRPDQIKELIKWYLSSSISERLGVSLATCLSTYVINLWKASVSSQPIYPSWKPP